MNLCGPWEESTAASKGPTGTNALQRFEKVSSRSRTQVAIGMPGRSFFYGSGLPHGMTMLEAIRAALLSKWWAWTTPDKADKAHLYVRLSGTRRTPAPAADLDPRSSAEDGHLACIIPRPCSLSGRAEGTRSSYGATPAVDGS